MTPDRLDDLLQQTLALARIPADATPEERKEIEELLAMRAALRQNAAAVGAEADAAMPTARARFQRHLQEQAQPATRPVARQVKPGFLARLFAPRILALGSSVAALAVIALVAVVVLQPFGGVETASALTIDDYVQVQGVVSANNGGTVTVQSSELGDLQIAFSDQTTVSDEQGTRATSTLQPGDPVLVSGVVTAKRAIAASNVAVAQNQGIAAGTVKAKATLLKAFRQGLQGSITLLSLSPDGQRARVLLVTNSESLLVDVDPRSMDQFLATSPRAVGALVRVVEAPDLPKGVFRLQVVEASGGGPSTAPTRAAAPQFQNVRGTVVSRRADVLMVKTDRGTVPVVIKLTTSIRFGDSGLTLADIRAGETVIGYDVQVSGNLDEASGKRVIATLIVVIGKGTPTAR